MPRKIKRIVSKTACKNYFNTDMTGKFIEHLKTSACDFLEKNMIDDNFATVINATITAFIEAMTQLSRHMCSTMPPEVNAKNETFLKALYNACDTWAANIVDEVH